MTPADLPITYALGESIHVDHPEDPKVQINRLALFPQGCLVLEAPDGSILGYCVSHPGTLGRTPALNSTLDALPGDADCLYIHDVCLRPECRGQGHLPPLMERLRALAAKEGFSRMALTAVSGAEAVWARVGFTPWVGDEALRAKLATYAGQAVPMVLNLGST